MKLIRTEDMLHYVGAADEVIYDPDRRQLVKHDGVTRGGLYIAEEELTILSSSNGSVFALFVANDGALFTVPIPEDMKITGSHSR